MTSHFGREKLPRNSPRKTPSAFSNTRSPSPATILNHLLPPGHDRRPWWCCGRKNGEKKRGFNGDKLSKHDHLFIDVHHLFYKGLTHLQTQSNLKNVHNVWSSAYHQNFHPFLEVSTRTLGSLWHHQSHWDGPTRHLGRPGSQPRSCVSNQRRRQWRPWRQRF